VLGPGMGAEDRERLLALLAAEESRKSDDARDISLGSHALCAASSSARGRGPQAPAASGPLSDDELLAAAFADLQAEHEDAHDGGDDGRAADGDAALEDGAEASAAAVAGDARLRELLALADASDGSGAGGATLTLASLTNEERRAFLRAVAAGHVSDVVAPWAPWWGRPHNTSELATQLLTAASPAQGSTARSAGASSCTGVVLPAAAALASPIYALLRGNGELPSCARPTVPESTAAAGSEMGEASAPSFCVARLPAPLPALSALVKQRPPEDILSCNVTNVLLAYCHVQRLYAGDWSDEAPQELATLLLHLSAVLAADARFGALEDAVAAYDAAARNDTVALTATVGKAAGAAVALLPLQDVAALLSGSWESADSESVSASLAAGAAQGGRMRLPDEGVARPRGGPLVTALAGSGSGTAEAADATARHHMADALLHARQVLQEAAAEAQRPVPASSAVESAAAVRPLRHRGLGGRSSGLRKQLQGSAHKLFFLAAWACDPEFGLSSTGLAAVRAGVAEAVEGTRARQRELADAAAELATLETGRESLVGPRVPSAALLAPRGLPARAAAGPSLPTSPAVAAGGPRPRVIELS